MSKLWVILAANVIAFAFCFATWTINGVLVTYLVQEGVFTWSEMQIGLLLGLPILSGSIVRLPLGVLSDKYGGKSMFILVLLVASLSMLYTSHATSYTDFLISSLIFGIAGGSFAVGVAYISACFEKEKQGFVLGIFGGGNLGAGLTTLFAPQLLEIFTNHGKNLEGWRELPRLYAAILGVTAVIFYLITTNKVIAKKKSLKDLIEPLKYPEVYRYSFYYMIFFGGYVGLTQWLVLYFVNAYEMSIALAGAITAAYSISASLMRIVGGKLSDLISAKKLLQVMSITALIVVGFLSVPMMDIQTVGKGVSAKAAGKVISVNENEIVIEEAGEKTRTYPLLKAEYKPTTSFHIFPDKTSWQESLVKAGNSIEKKQLIAKGINHIYFQANVWIFSFLAILLGIIQGIGMGAVYKLIPSNFPQNVGTVGGVVGMLGSLGGFVYPIIFGALLQWFGLWSICWMFFMILLFFAIEMEKREA